MKKVWRVVWISLAALGCAIGANCGSNDDTPARAHGKVGESCSSRDDCDGLACISNVCTVEGDAVPDGGMTAVLSQAGESCHARADCTLGLVCVNQVCVTPGLTDASLQTGVGERGESCQTRADCVAGLACVSGVCAVADYGLQPTGKECVAVACKVTKDCCPTESVSCQFYRDQCALAGDASTSYYCQLVQTSCTCDETKYSCAADKCVTKVPCADSGIACNFGTVCNGTNCVECVKDTDCASGTAVCSNEKCVAKCTYDTDCASFSKCTNGACVLSGCKTNRECVAYTSSVLSTCDTATGGCKTPCSNDLECSNATTGAVGKSICVNGYCADSGCETDEECKIWFQKQFGRTRYAECRAKK